MTPCSRLLRTMKLFINIICVSKCNFFNYRYCLDWIFFNCRKLSDKVLKLSEVLHMMSQHITTKHSLRLASVHRHLFCWTKFLIKRTKWKLRFTFISARVNSSFTEHKTHNASKQTKLKFTCLFKYCASVTSTNAIFIPLYKVFFTEYVNKEFSVVHSIWWYRDARLSFLSVCLES